MDTVPQKIFDFLKLAGSVIDELALAPMPTGRRDREQIDYFYTRDRFEYTHRIRMLPAGRLGVISVKSDDKTIWLLRYCMDLSKEEGLDEGAAWRNLRLARLRTEVNLFEPFGPHSFFGEAGWVYTSDWKGSLPMFGGAATLNFQGQEVLKINFSGRWKRDRN